MNVMHKGGKSDVDNSTGKVVRAKLLSCLIFLSSALAAPPAIASDGQQLFLADAARQPGKLVRVTWDGDRPEVNWVHMRPSSVPGGTSHLSDVAFASDGNAYLVSGLDNHIRRFTRSTEEPFYSHSKQVRQVAFATSPHTLYFSEMVTPTSPTSRPDGRIYALDVRTHVPRLFYTVRQDQVGFDWWGSFAFQGDTLYLSTLRAPARVYKIEDGTPVQVYECDHEIGGIAFAGPRDLYFTDNNRKVFRARNLRDLSLVIDFPDSKLAGLAFAPRLTPGTCSIAGTVAGPPSVRSMFHLIVIGPHHDLWEQEWVRSPAGAIGADGTYRISNLPAGRYWISLDTRADVWVAPVPRERQVNCQRATLGVDFRLEGG